MCDRSSSPERSDAGRGGINCALGRRFSSNVRVAVGTLGSNSTCLQGGYLLGLVDTCLKSGFGRIIGDRTGRGSGFARVVLRRAHRCLRLGTGLIGRGMVVDMSAERLES